LPYVSAQAIRRALRDKLSEILGEEAISPVAMPSEKKGAAKTQMNPVQYIDDDLFGFMDAKGDKEGGKGTSTTRTSPIRVESLVAISKYQGDLDFGTNYMSKSIGGDPNIFETEIHSGYYRGTILIELDRIGCGDGFTKENELKPDEKKKRVLAFIDAFRNLWSSGRQSCFLADISPKFIAAAYMKTKNPIFLESVNIYDGKLDTEKLKSVTNDYDKYIESHIFAAQSAVFEASEDIKSLKKGFEEIEKWIGEYYKEEK